MKRLLKDFWTSKKPGWIIARVALLVLAAVAVLIMAFEDKFIYFPAKYPEGFWAVDQYPHRDGEIVPRITDCYFRADDGVKLHGWYCSPHRSAGGMLTAVQTDTVLLWFHGNSGNISYRYEMIRMLASIPVNIFIIDYRGYGKSEGAPTEGGLYLDAQAAWNYLARERGMSRGKIIILGKSLGGVPAIDLASKVEPAGLIVQSSFTSVADMAATVLPFFPALLLRTKMDSINKIANVRCPKLIIHSPADEVVPYEFGRRLYEAAPEPKQFYEVAGARHNVTYRVGGRAYLERLRQFIQSCAQKTKP